STPGQNSGASGGRKRANPFNSLTANSPPGGNARYTRCTARCGSPRWCRASAAHTRSGVPTSGQVSSRPACPLRIRARSPRASASCFNRCKCSGEESTATTAASGNCVSSVNVPAPVPHPRSTMVRGRPVTGSHAARDAVCRAKSSALSASMSAWLPPWWWPWLMLSTVAAAGSAVGLLACSAPDPFLVLPIAQPASVVAGSVGVVTMPAPGVAVEDAEYVARATDRAECVRQHRRELGRLVLLQLETPVAQQQLC